MSIILLIIVFNASVLLIAFKTKKFLYTVSPEKQWSKAIKEFDENLKAIDQIGNTTNYKLGTNHIYNTTKKLTH